MKTTDVKPGDTILEKKYFGVYLIADINTSAVFKEKNKTRFFTDDRYVLFLSDDELEIIEPSDTIAKPGDTIIITDSCLVSDFGKKYIVIEPACPPKPVNDVVDCVYTDTGIGQAIFHHRSYETIKRTNISPLVSCSDCNGTGEIQLFTSVAKCKCCLGDE